MDDVPTKCPRCGSKELKHEEFSVHGKVGIVGPDYRFDVYICEACRNAQFFFQGAKWIR